MPRRSCAPVGHSFRYDPRALEEDVMTLKEQLDKLREASKTRIPPEPRTTMARSVEDLGASGITSRIVKVGQAARDVTLPNAGGRQVSLAELRARGPVVLSFYRGRW